VLGGKLRQTGIRVASIVGSFNFPVSISYQSSQLRQELKMICGTAVMMANRGVSPQFNNSATV